MNGWKVAAIIFIGLFIVETIVVVYFIWIGVDMIAKEQECIHNVCKDSKTYYYDDYNEVCYCYTDGILDKTKFIK